MPEVQEATQSMGAATLRTALPATWAAVVLWIATKLGLSVSTDDLVILAPLFGALVALVYRIARELEARFPTFGRLFLGSAKQPVYVEATANEV